MERKKPCTGTNNNVSTSEKKEINASNMVTIVIGLLYLLINRLKEGKFRHSMMTVSDQIEITVAINGVIFAKITNNDTSNGENKR